MKKWILIFGLILCLASQADAGCYYGDCYTFEPGVTDNCGKGCTYTYDDETGTVYVTASGNDAEMRLGAFFPGSYENNVIGVTINNVVIDGKIALSEHALYGMEYSVTGVDNTLNFSKIGWHSLENKNINSDIIISDDTQIDIIGLYNAHINGKIYCALEDCAEKLRQSCRSHFDESVVADCLSQIEPVLSDSNKFAQAPQGCSSFNGNGCNSCNRGYSLSSNQCVCAQNHRVNGKNCNRLIYTIEEANAVAGDKNRVSIRYR